MKAILAVFLLTGSALSAYATGIGFPDFNMYTEMGSNGTLSSSYKIDMNFDTGLKYGVQVGLGLKNYAITSLSSNLVMLDSLRLTVKPYNLFNFGYFLGKNMTLGDTKIGYRGFQYHQRPGLEYIGFKDIRGMGIDLSMDLFDNVFQPHVMIYQPDYAGTLYLDTVYFVRMDNYEIQVFFGINDLNLVNAMVSNTLAKHFGVFIKTVFGKIDLMLGLYSPESPLTNLMPADDFYLNITEHITLGWFEQTLALMTRPSFYNGVRESVTNDMDFYLSVGMKIEDIGFGIENTFAMAANYSISDRLGAYLYLMMNNLQYKIGFYYNIMGNAWASPFGGFISVTGSL